MSKYLAVFDPATVADISERQRRGRPSIATIVCLLVVVLAMSATGVTKWGCSVFFPKSSVEISMKILFVHGDGAKEKTLAAEAGEKEKAAIVGLELVTVAVALCLISPISGRKWAKCPCWGPFSAGPLRRLCYR